MTQEEKWLAVESGIQALIERCQAADQLRAELEQQVEDLKGEIRRLQGLRGERDRLRSEREVVRKRVLEMLQQLEKIQL